MKQQHSLPAMAAIAVMMLALTACGGNTPAVAPGEGNIPTASASPQPTEITSTMEPSQPDSEPSEVIKGIGIYVGQIDNHSVEIKTEGGPTAFELGAGTENATETLNMDDPVIFEYVEKSVEGDETLKQRVLSKLVLADENSSSQSSPGDALPQSKKLKLELEGMPEEKTAELVNAKGYSLYVFDIFTFDSVSNKLAMKVDPQYFAEVIKLPSDYNLDYLQLEGEQYLAATGNIKKLKQSEIPGPMADAALYLSASGSSVTREYIVKELEGQGYIFKLNIPRGEPSEGFSPHVFSSLNSIVTQ